MSVSYEKIGRVMMLTVVGRQGRLVRAEIGLVRFATGQFEWIRAVLDGGRCGCGGCGMVSYR